MIWVKISYGYPYVVERYLHRCMRNTGALASIPGIMGPTASLPASIPQLAHTPAVSIVGAGAAINEVPHASDAMGATNKNQK
jgi:hypothetical protein